MDVAGAGWRKSSFSNGGGGGNCVEVAFLPDDTVAVRDTKDRSFPPHVYAAPAWRALLTAIRAGEFSL